MRALAAAVIAIAISLPAWGAIPVATYRSELARLDAALARNDRASAATIAQALLGEQVVWNGGMIATDRSLLAPIADASGTLSTIDSRRRVTATIAALGSTRDERAPIAEDRALLDRLKASQAPTELRRGGEIETLPVANDGFWAEVGRRLGVVWDWISENLLKLWEWLMSFWPSSQDDEESTSFLGLPLSVTALVLAIVAILLLLAIEIWRRGKRVKREVTQSDVVTSAGGNDDDPLSRETNEWERYAAELAAAGRVREAIRAWYHAVLVAMFRTGTLQYRKGRTNWEYVSALPATVPWRASFTGLTRIFDREWYGRDRSTVEALDTCASTSRKLLEAIRRQGARS
jgi:hypothetical protein